MDQASLTGTESFAARLLRSERWRIGLMASALLVTLLLVIGRRALGGVVMTANAVFVPTVGVLIVGLLYQGAALRVILRRSRDGSAIPGWQRVISVAVDLAVPGLALLILVLNSPRSAYAALSAPALLLMPLVILLSILRLRPWFSFGTGAGAAIIHFTLAVLATRISNIERDHLPVIFSYGILLLLTGTAAAVVSWMARRYVSEAVQEATAAEHSLRTVALIEQDLRVAHDIQMGLMPSDRPAMDGYHVAGMARPAAQAGGDYYDWQALPDGRMVVAIADVTGHGIGPALVMAVCRAYARASVPTCDGPEMLLARLNDLIFEDVKGSRFITMAVAIVSANGEVELVSAGHGPTLLYHAASNQVELFGGDGLPLGIFSDQCYGPRRTFQMDSGDVLVMLTDGFVEYARAGDRELFGHDRLTEVVRACASLHSEGILRAIDRAVDEFAVGAVQEDDMTAVVIKRV